MVASVDFFELIGARHSVRRFQEKKVEETKLRQILRAANSAPSAGNLQAFKIVVVKSEVKRQQLAAAALGQQFVSQARLVLVFVADLKRSAGRYSNRGRELYALQDATIACAYAQLAAQQLGLSSVWVGAFDAATVSDAINAGKDMLPVAILPIGYAAEKPYVTGRRKESEIFAEDCL
jgi:nitroreductase